MSVASPCRYHAACVTVLQRFGRHCMRTVPMPQKLARTLRQFYDAMFETFGPQHWWAGESRAEIIIGAILTQNTNWRNVKLALENLRASGLLNWSALRDIEISSLAEQIRPAGYFNVKARRLKNFVEWLWQHHNGKLDSLSKLELGPLREELLAINGIGPETADSILLYALDKPSFVIDAYTGRIARRHGIKARDYHELQAVFENNLPRDIALFNEYHALIVAVGKHHCKPTAKCEGCPLERFDHDEYA